MRGTYAYVNPMTFVTLKTRARKTMGMKLEKSSEQ